MLRPIVVCALLVTCLAAAGSAMWSDSQSPSPITFTDEEKSRILQHSPLPAPPHDASNRYSSDEGAARFGQFLFFDTRFSPDNAVSCSTCHDPAKGFSDGRQLSKGLKVVERHAQALWNVAHNRWFFWDGRADSLWSQALVPLERPDEMGGDRAGIAHAIFRDVRLRAAYEGIFGRMIDVSDAERFPAHAMPVADAPHDPLNVAWRSMREEDQRAINAIFANIGKALAAYESKIISRDAPFDRFVAGLREGDIAKQAAISDSAKRGLKIFVGRGNCRLCHSGPNFSDGEFHSVAPPTLTGEEPTDAARFAGIDKLKTSAFNALGAFTDDPDGAASKRLAALINKPDNWGQFKTPSLRSVALTAPYMHQGQYGTLRQAIEHYSTLADAVQIGHHREKILRPLNLSEQEMQDLQAFLESLTGAPLPENLLRQAPGP